MQEKNYKKFYFLDTKIHTSSQMLAKIKNENFAGVIFRKNQNFECHNFDENFTKTVLKLCKERKILVFSPVNKIQHDVFYYGSKFEKKLTKKKCSFVVHNAKDLRIIKKIKPEYVFISPVFQTKTHPEMKPLGIICAFKIIKNITNLMPNSKIILLGGMTNEHFRAIKKLDFHNKIYGFAGIRF